MPYKIKVDKDKCIGCGACESICPEIFEIKDSKSSPKKPVTEKLTCEKEAEEVCPVKAISVTKE